MKRRIRIITTAVSICLVFAVMCIGIYAAAQVTINSTGGNLSFNADNVLATVTLKQGDFSESDQKVSIEEGYEELGSFAFNNVTFATTQEEKTFQVVVKNDFAEGSNIKISSKLTASVSGEDFKVTIEKGIKTTGEEITGSAQVSSGEAVDVSVGENVIYTVTVKFVGEANNTASDTLKFSLELTKAQAAQA